MVLNSLISIFIENKVLYEYIISQLTTMVRRGF